MSLIIWIDELSNTETINGYEQEFSLSGYNKFKWFKNYRDAIKQIVNNEYVEKIFIIIKGELYAEFIKEFKSKLKDIYIIPYIIIFTENKEEFVKRFPNILEYQFYNLGGIQINFENIKKCILNFPKEETELNTKDEDEEKILFEFIDSKEQLLLPLLYKTLIEIDGEDKIANFNAYLYNKYSKNDKKLEKLLSSINNISNIPIEILSKYYTRLYTDKDSFFHFDINKNLIENEKDKYIPYIEVLYEGVKLSSLLPTSDNFLFKGGKLLNIEIEKIKEYLKEKNEGLPGAILFSKTFLSFTKEREIVENNLNLIDINKNEISKVLYILEIDENIDACLETNTDLEKNSYFPNEGKVLFFPFSSFEIEEIKEIFIEDEKLYEIKLIYLGKYLEEFHKDEKFMKQPNIAIPDSTFKNEIIKSGLIKPQYADYYNDGIKLFQKFDVFKKEMVNPKKKKKKIKNKNEINIIYRIKENENKIKIFGSKFVSNNENNCKIIYEGRKNQLTEYFGDFKNINNSNNNYLQITLEVTKKLDNISYMFHGCSLLSFLPDISNLNISNFSDMSYMFSGCSSLAYLSDISNWDTSNIINMNYLFHGCASLTSLPDISNWNTSNVSYMNGIFHGCSSLKILPDISKWNTSNVIDMSYMFFGCRSLKSLPNINNWNTSHLTNMSYMFYNCRELSSLPKFSNWNTSNVTNMTNLFSFCTSITSLPNLMNFKTQNVIDMSGMFYNCSSLKSPPNLSNFKTQNVIDMSGMFYNCSSLTSPPDLSNFNTQNVVNMSYMFYNCSSLTSPPNINNFNTLNVTNMSYMFSNCSSLKSLPDFSNIITNNLIYMNGMFIGCDKNLKIPDKFNIYHE